MNPVSGESPAVAKTPVDGGYPTDSESPSAEDSPVRADTPRSAVRPPSAVRPETGAETEARPEEARPETGPASRALIFLLGTRVLATLSAPGGRVVEIDSWTRVPAAPAHLLGVANAQGSVLALVDVRRALGLPEPPWPSPLRAVVVGGDRLRAAVAIEGVLGFESCFPALARAPQGALPDGLEGYARGVLDLPPWRPLLVDLPAVVESLRLRRAGSGPQLHPDSPPDALSAPDPGRRIQR